VGAVVASLRPNQLERQRWFGSPPWQAKRARTSGSGTGSAGMAWPSKKAEH